MYYFSGNFFRDVAKNRNNFHSKSRHVWSYTYNRETQFLAQMSLMIKRHTTSYAEKIYRLKEDQAFSLSLELGRLRHPSADLLPSPHPTSIGGGGKDFVDTVEDTH